MHTLQLRPHLAWIIHDTSKMLLLLLRDQQIELSCRFLRTFLSQASISAVSAAVVAFESAGIGLFDLPETIPHSPCLMNHALAFPTQEP